MIRPGGGANQCDRAVIALSPAEKKRLIRIKRTFFVCNRSRGNSKEHSWNYPVNGYGEPYQSSFPRGTVGKGNGRYLLETFDRGRPLRTAAPLATAWWSACSHALRILPQSSRPLEDSGPTREMRTPPKQELSPCRCRRTRGA